MKKQIMKETKNQYLVAFLVSFSIYFIFQLSYFNRFLPVQEAWFIEYAKQFNNGKFIYTDFHVFIQPIYVFIFSIISDLFDYSIITFRYYGLLERALLFGTVFITLAQIFTPYKTLFLTLLCLFLFSANTADVIYSYYQLTAIFVFVSALFLIKYSKKCSCINIYWSGVFSGLAFMTKQSTGLLVPVALIITMLVLHFAKIDPEKFTLNAIGKFIAGVLTPILLILGYLYMHSAIDEYWIQVFQSTESKGTVVDILFGFWLPVLKEIEFLWLTGFLVIFFILYINRTFTFSALTRLNQFIAHKDLALGITGLLLIIFAACIPVIINDPLWFSELDLLYGKVQFFTSRNKFVYAIFILNALLIIFYFYKVLTKKFTSDEVPVGIIAVTSFAFMYGHGMSGFIEPHAAIIAAGLITGLFLNIQTLFNSVKNLLLYCLIIFMVGMMSYEKYAWMYSWWGWDERKAWYATYTSEIPALKGFYLSKDKVEILDGITKLIVQNSKEGDAIYTFPHIPLFYLLSERERVTFSAVHYFDVCPDKIARSDAKLISQSKPNVIVVMHFPDEAWDIHEQIFRGGNKSGQRDIQILIDKFKSSGEYKSLKKYITSGYNYEIEVLVKDQTFSDQKISFD